MIRAERIYSDIAEIATLAVGPVPRIAEAMGELGRVEDGAIAVDRGRIAWVGPRGRLRREVRLRSGGKRVDLQRASVVPGFVDAHTHALFAGDRSREIALKLAGKSYTEILAAGGGILSTVRATRAASTTTLRYEARGRLDRMLRSGTTSAEVKSGYALDHDGELRLLRLVPALARASGMRLVATFLGAHAVPPEFEGRADAYVDQIVRRTLPVVARERLARFCDVFCEPGFFTVEQSERVLRAAFGLGLGLKIHADEFVYSGGARLAASLKARSAEHLLLTPPEDRELLAASGVTTVLLPVTPFASFAGTRSPGREMVDARVPVALGTDLSPNSEVESMTTVLSHAVYSARLTPVEAITAATVNAAHATDLSASAGMIAVGRPADFVAFDVHSVERIPVRVGSIPTLISRQGIPVASR